MVLFYLQLEKLHKTYGPIVRISPNEIHLRDPDYYDKVYTKGSKYDKDSGFYSLPGGNDTSAISSNVLHRQKRAPLTSFFSQRAIFDPEGMIHEKVESLSRTLDENNARGIPVDLHDGYRALAIDVTTEYAFDDCRDHLENPTSDAARLPLKKSRKNVQATQYKIDQGVKPIRRTIFHNLLDPPLNTGPGLLTVDDMESHAFSLCVAASDTVGNALTVASYSLMRNTEIHELLKRELRHTFPDPTQRLSYAKLEKLPCLSGLLKEAQRLAYGVVSRLPRLVPPERATFNGYFVPGGTIVSMSNYLMHRSPEAFPDPDTFDPSMWIKQPADIACARESCFVPFGRGSRACLGQILALYELYLVLGTMVRRYEKVQSRDVGPLVCVDYFKICSPDDAKPLDAVTVERAAS
ncbi:cytochrome P450 [Thozetella sp. PMI_491]|nr:cytochrome P450 [Thozetella sp. PMI_491]